MGWLYAQERPITDKEKKIPWAQDTVGIIFSSTKGLTALCAMILADRGQLDYDAPRVRRMELPWSNGVANARALATIYAALIGADGRGDERLVKTETWHEVTRRQSWQEKDAVLLKPLGWSQGFLKEETKFFSPNPESFGHPGVGGALGWADPVAELSIGYVMNRMDFHLRSRRVLALCRSIYQCL